MEIMQRHTFETLLKANLSTATPIDSPEFLRGRGETLEQMRQALVMVGRHAFIFGYRGVGKTSLAETTAAVLQSSDANPIRVLCDETTTFGDIALEIFRKASGQYSNETRSRKVSGKAEIPHLSAELETQHTLAPLSRPNTVSEAVDAIARGVRQHSREPVVVIDEFDTINNDYERRQITLMLKELSDSRAPIKLILCGVGDSLDKLLSSHGSAHRYLHTVQLDRLSITPCCDIVNGALSAVGIETDDTTLYRIARVSDGFPHYVHLQAEKALWRWFDSGAEGPLLAEHYVKGLEDAVASVGAELKKPYEKVVKSIARMVNIFCGPFPKTTNYLGECAMFMSNRIYEFALRSMLSQLAGSSSIPE